MLQEILERMESRERTGLAAADLERLERQVAAALLIWTMRADGRFVECEKETFRRLLAERFALGPDAVEELVREAAKVDYWVLFTERAGVVFGLEERSEIVETMWEVALADSDLHRLEEDLIRRVARTLNVADETTDALRQRVLARLRTSR